MRVIKDRPRSVDIDEFLSKPLVAHLATASGYGPRDSPVWFLWEEGAIWIIGNQKTDTFPRRIQHEPRCAISIVNFDKSVGLFHHVGLRGRGKVEPFDRERAGRLLARYLGEAKDHWDRRFIETLDDPDNVFIRFDPETAVTRDVSYIVN